MRAVRRTGRRDGGTGAGASLCWLPEELRRADAAGYDVRRMCDLFGLSISAALGCANTFETLI